jgi:shikimate kinase
MEIVLMGYMGSGKSTVGKYISDRGNLSFIDLDTYIEQREELSINEIFRRKGEIYFRIKEAFYLKEVLDTKKNYVLSLGGGTPCYGTNMNSIKESTAISYYLRASIPTLVARLEKGKQNRPLIATLNDDQLMEYIGKHLFERAPFYEQANFKMNINDTSVEEIADEIFSKLNMQ